MATPATVVLPVYTQMQHLDWRTAHASAAAAWNVAARDSR